MFCRRWKARPLLRIRYGCETPASVQLILSQRSFAPLRMTTARRRVCHFINNTERLRLISRVIFRCMQDRFTGKSRGFAFVTMSSDEEAQNAISKFNGHTMDGRPMTVNEARPREQRPPGGGGGGGGRYGGGGYGGGRRDGGGQRRGGGY